MILEASEVLKIWSAGPDALANFTQALILSFIFPPFQVYSEWTLLWQSTPCRKYQEQLLKKEVSTPTLCTNLTNCSLVNNLWCSASKSWAGHSPDKVWEPGVSCTSLCVLALFLCTKQHTTICCPKLLSFVIKGRYDISWSLFRLSLVQSLHLCLWLLYPALPL